MLLLKKYPPEITAPKITRRIHQTDRSVTHGGGRAGRGRRLQRGRSRGGGRTFGGRGGGGLKRNYHPDMYSVTLKNGKSVNCHSLFHFPPETWVLLPLSVQRRIQMERAQYKRQHADRTIKSLSRASNPYSLSQYQSTTYQGSVSSVAPQYVPPPPPVIHI